MQFSIPPELLVTMFAAVVVGSAIGIFCIWASTKHGTSFPPAQTSKEQQQPSPPKLSKEQEQLSSMCSQFNNLAQKVNRFMEDHGQQSTSRQNHHEQQPATGQTQYQQYNGGRIPDIPVPVGAVSADLDIVFHFPDPRTRNPNGSPETVSSDSPTGSNQQFTTSNDTTIAPQPRAASQQVDHESSGSNKNSSTETSPDVAVDVDLVPFNTGRKQSYSRPDDPRQGRYDGAPKDTQPPKSPPGVGLGLFQKSS